MQHVTYTLRLPDAAQSTALHMLKVSRTNINAVIETLWPQLAAFTGGKNQAWKQVASLVSLAPRPGAGRQQRCEADVAGRILRSQAARRAAFALIAPLLTTGLIHRAAEKKKARTNRRALRDAIAQLRADVGADVQKYMLLLNVTEQACNYYLANERFPESYEEMQPLPLLQAGMVSYAGDDGPTKGQSYRFQVDLPTQTASLRFKYPDATGRWVWSPVATIPLPAVVIDRLAAEGELAAPTLRAVLQPDGMAVACLDLVIAQETPDPPAWETCDTVVAFDWGVRQLLTLAVVRRDGQQQSRPFFLNIAGYRGKQQRTREQIAHLQAKRDRVTDKHPAHARLQREIDRCWGAYERRNRALAHLAANVLLVVATLSGSTLIVGEDLASLKARGKGRGTKGRAVNWNTNTTIRGEIWRVLTYKAKLAGIRTRTVQPRATSHTCPRCGAAAQTTKSPQHREKAIDWGRWLICTACCWNGSRDYAAALNIGRLGLVLVENARTDGPTPRRVSLRDTSPKPLAYTGSGAALPFPPRGLVSDTRRRGHGHHQHDRIHVVGWPKSVRLSPMRTHHCVQLLA